MKRALLLCLVSLSARADVLLGDAGPVVALRCAGAGISCTRSGSTGVLTVSGSSSDGGAVGTFANPLFNDGGTVGCLPAGSGDGGCVTNGTQDFLGAKDFKSKVAIGPTAPLEWLDVNGGGAMIRGANAGLVGSSGVTLEYAGGAGYIGAVNWTVAWTNLNLIGHELVFFTSSNAAPQTQVEAARFDPAGALTVTSADARLNGLKVPVVHGTGTAAQAIESGAAAMTGGALAISFTTAFAAAPKCVCSHVNAVPISCGISTAPSTSAVTFAVPAGGTDTIDYVCIGAR